MSYQIIKYKQYHTQSFFIEIIKYIKSSTSNTLFSTLSPALIFLLA